MFEAGSDLETLILKYNVGDTIGMQSYTIDAIKYVDGESIKDVRMEGDKTVSVLVGSSNQTVNFNEQFVGWDLVLSPEWNDSFTGERVFTSLSVYDGDTLIESYDPSTTVIRGLPESSRLLLVATYVENEEVITKKSVITTPKQSEGLTVVGGVITGIGTCSDTVLYINMPTDKEAFINNSHIEKIYFGTGATSIGENAFASCSTLTEIVLPEGIKAISGDAFRDCGNLTSVNLPETLESIGASAFAYCTKLANISLPDTLTFLGGGAFAGCEALTEFVIPQGVKNLGYNSDSPFAICINLTTLYIKNSQIAIYTYYDQEIIDETNHKPYTIVIGTLFHNCPAIKDVYFDGTLEEWEKITEIIDAWCGYPEQTITIHCTDGDIILKDLFLM